MNTYSFERSSEVGRDAVSDVVEFLSNSPKIEEIKNVEHDKEYQKIDVDLVLKYKHKENVLVEVKGDTYHKTGNFFFETISNKEKDSPGCFMYSEADWFFYYFITPQILYTLPLEETREWFKNNIDDFETKTLRTSVGDGYYESEGKLVPIFKVMENIEDAKKYDLSEL